MASGVISKSALRFGSNLGQYPVETSGTDELLLGAYDMINLLNENITGTPQNEREPNLLGEIGFTSRDLIGIDFGGDITIEGQYEGLNQLFTAAFGALSKTQVSTNEYSHVYTLSSAVSQVDGIPRRVTIGFDKKTSLWIARACMIDKMTLNYNIASGLNISATVIAYDLINDSSVNTSSSNWKIINTYNSEKIMGHQLGFTIDSADETIQSFTISINNHLEVPDKTIQSGLYIPEPVMKDYREVTGTISFPRYTTDDYLLDKYSSTTRALSFVFTGQLMDTINKSLTISLPKAKFQNSNIPISSPGGIKKTLEFECFKSVGSSDMITAELRNRYPYNDILGER